ncbi:hypothetical protein EON83_26305 [bacterium]|nr:MAG: hypothetical protein EON83_26305 [bacterium]
MKIRFFLAGALLLCAPVMVLLPGCGGGSSAPSINNLSSNISLSPAQSGVVTLSVRGGIATGTLLVSEASASNARQTRALGLLPAGSYPFSGSFASPSTFNVGGTITGVGAFTIAGEIPRNGSDGNYTITAGGKTVNGSFFVPRTATPLPTTVTRGVAKASLTLITSGDEEFGSPFFDASDGTVVGNRSSYTITLSDSLGRTIEFKNIKADEATVGTKYSLGGTTTLEAGSGGKFWGGSGISTGSVKVQKIEGNTITFQFDSDILLPSGATSTLFVSGTITAPIK